MKRSKLFKRIGLSVLLLIVVIIGTGFYEIKSTVSLPEPTGSFSVGTQSFCWVDTSRAELLTSDNDDKRELLVQVWYPIDLKDITARATYHPNPEIFSSNVEALYDVPAILIDRLSMAKTNSYLNAKLSDKELKYPVIIFSHGSGGSRFQNTFQVEELASNGYIIFSIEHSYVSSGTVLPSNKNANLKEAWDIKDDSFSTLLTEIWTGDQIFVMNQIEKLNSGEFKSIFMNKLDLDKVGLFGHSFGGSTSANSLTRDKRFKAGINMDGFYFGEGYKSGFSQPFLEIRADLKPSDEMTEDELTEFQLDRDFYQYLFFDEWNKRINAYALNGVDKVVVKGATHFDFSDLPLIMPFAKFLSDADKIHKATNEITLAFFNTHLKNYDHSKYSRLLENNPMLKVKS